LAGDSLANLLLQSFGKEKFGEWVHPVKGLVKKNWMDLI